MSDSFATPWTVAHQAPLSMGFPRQEYWNRLPFLPPGRLPDPGMEAESPALAGDSLPSEPPGKPIPMANSALGTLEAAYHLETGPSPPPAPGKNEKFGGFIAKSSQGF